MGGKEGGRDGRRAIYNVNLIIMDCRRGEGGEGRMDGCIRMSVVSGEKRRLSVVSGGGCLLYLGCSLYLTIW